uniref:Mucin-5AC n=1 Tax=Anopheles epiroticus TaxID=199890 RepID=A0A182PXB6_9DIPT
MILASKQLLLWIALGSLIGAIAAEEDVGTTTPVLEAQTTTSPATVTEPFTTTSSSTSTTTTTPSSSTSTILSRANPISSSIASRSVLSTTASTTIGTTTKPSTKRQISLSEFQQLVAKVNDEISMLRNQSANLSQTYEELIRRYNERTSQIPIVLYDVTECSNSTAGREEASTDVTKKSTTPSTVTPTTVTDSTENASTTSRRPITTTTTESTTTSTSTTIVPTTTRQAEYTPPKLQQSEFLPDLAGSPLEAVPQNAGSSHTQIYGNKYYNYIHYFMYPPSESQLEELESVAPLSQRRKIGNDSRRVGPLRRRQEGPFQATKNKFREDLEDPEYDDQQQSTAFRRRPVIEPRPTGELRTNLRLDYPDLVAEYGNQQPSTAFRRRPIEEPKPTGELRTNLRLDSTDLVPRVPPGNPIDADVPYPYRAGLAPPRKPPVGPPTYGVPPKAPQYPFVQERIPPRSAPQEELFAAVPEAQRPNAKPALGSVPKAPATPPPSSPYSDKLTAFLERRKINRNDPFTVTPTRKPTIASTPSPGKVVTLPSIDSLFTFAAKPVSYAIPTTVKPAPGVVRNDWDGYDFAFIHKALETKKRLQRERRSWGAGLRDL